MALLDLIQKDQLTARTREARNALSANTPECTQKGQRIFDSIKVAKFEDISDGLEKAIYDIVSQLTSEKMPPLDSQTSGDPEWNTMVVPVDDGQNSFEEGEALIYLGNGEGILKNGSIENDFDSSCSWRYAYDEEIESFFRNV